jgi:hypothetical protein
MASRVLLFGCQHHPNVNRESLDWLYTQIEEFRPHILINLGDALDGIGWSRHLSNADWTQEDEYESFRDDVAYLNSLPFVKERYWIYGNHDNNYEEPGRLPPKIKSLVHWRNWNPEEGTSLRTELADWHIVPHYGSHIRRAIGPLVVAHGTKIGIHATRDEALMQWQLPNTLTVTAHTHRAMPVTRVVGAGGILTDLYCANVGTHIDWLRSEYQFRNYFGAWSNGCVCLETSIEDLRMKTAPDYYPVKNWEAETRIRMYAKDDPRLR